MVAPVVPADLQLLQQRTFPAGSPGQAGVTHGQGEAGQAGAGDLAQQGPGAGGWRGGAGALEPAGGLIEKGRDPAAQ
jgi:hypothetical protein